MWQEDLARRLGETTNGQRNAIIGEYMAMTGKSAATLYRVARKHGFESGRKTRCDAGGVCVTDDQVRFVASLVATSRREVKGCIMDVETALSIAEDNGIIDPGTISVSRMQAILRERELCRAAIDCPTPHALMRSLHPNHVHVLDASVCIQYYLRAGKGLGILREDLFYKNKPANFGKIKQKIIRYVIVDHCSHCVFFRYYVAAGERMLDVFEFLKTAWRGGLHEKLPFRGVPFLLLRDPGAANISRPIMGLLEALGVECPEGMPHNARRQGSVETTHGNIIETKFESRLRFSPAATIEDLNAWAVDWACWFNAAKNHTRHRMTRTQCWLTIRPEQLRELPADDLMQYMFAHPSEERLVDGHWCISFAYKPGDSRTYSLRHLRDAGVIPGRTRVGVVVRPYTWPEITVIHDGVEYAASPMEVDAYGFAADAAVIGQEYRAVPQSETQRAVAEMVEDAYGEAGMRGEGASRRPKPHAVPHAGLQVFGIHAGKVEVDFLPKPGREMAVAGRVEAGAEARRLPVAEVLKRLVAASGGRLDPEVNRAVREAFGASVGVADARRLEELARGGRLTVAGVMGCQGGAGDDRKIGGLDG